jgi:hypothetical protein
MGTTVQGVLAHQYLLKAWTLLSKECTETRVLEASMIKIMYASKGNISSPDAYNGRATANNAFNIGFEVLTAVIMMHSIYAVISVF